MLRRRIVLTGNFVAFPSSTTNTRCASSYTTPSDRARDGILYNKFTKQAKAEREEKGVRDYTMVRQRPEALQKDKKEFYDYFIDDTGKNYSPSHKRTGHNHPISRAFSQGGVSAERRDALGASLKLAKDFKPHQGPWVDVSISLRNQEYVTELVPMTSDLPHLVPGEALVLDLDKSRESRRPFVLHLENELVVMPIFSVDAHAAVYFQKLEINDAFWFPFPRAGSQKETYEKLPQPVLGCAKFQEMARMATMAAPGKRLGIVINPFTEYTKFLTYEEMMNVVMAKDNEGNIIQPADTLKRVFNTRKCTGKRYDPIQLVRNRSLLSRAGFGPAALARTNPEDYVSRVSYGTAGEASSMDDAMKADREATKEEPVKKGGFKKKPLDPKVAEEVSKSGFVPPQNQEQLRLKEQMEEIRKERQKFVERAQEKHINAMGRAMALQDMAQTTSNYVPRPGDAELEDEVEALSIEYQCQGLDAAATNFVKVLCKIPEIARLELQLLLFNVKGLESVFLSSKETAKLSQWVKGSNKYRILVSAVVDKTAAEDKEKFAESLNETLSKWTFLTDGQTDFELEILESIPTDRQVHRLGHPPILPAPPAPPGKPAPPPLPRPESLTLLREVFRSDSKLVQNLAQGLHRADVALASKLNFDAGFGDEDETASDGADYTPRYATTPTPKPVLQQESILSGRVPRRRN